MIINKYSALLAAALAVASWNIPAQDNTDCQKPGTPEKIEGKITDVDVNGGKVTIKSADGKVHVFNASQETLKEYKVGQSLKMTLRCDK